jgi:two-component system, chemotaxis family, CheB/CheR fusion protein
MATKKKTEKGAKASEEARPAQQPVGAPEAPERSPATPVGVDPLESKPRQPGPPVVGIGASAGGLDAFKKLFTAMPADSGVAFVLIPHLDPNHESLMVELLARCTKMRVVEATDGMAVEANRIYIIPPNKYMTISGGCLRLTGPVERGGPQTSIDLFLRSLANDKQEKAICIILSGTGTHGSLGLKAIKAADGMAMVQDPITAEYPRMPQSAIATDLADYVLPPEQMPGALIQYVQHAYVNGAKIDAEGTEAPDHLNQALALVRVRTKFDFRSYRKKMLIRRIERRMSLSHIDQIADYVAFLRERPDEVKQLSRDMLISVTNFFRDSEAFQALENEVIVPLVRAKPPEATLRVWSSGCATGEEVYSLGILLLEQLAAATKNCPLQIFATDIDESALDVARRGAYPESIATDVSPERLGRFFTPVDDASYQVGKQLREIVIFARQNLIADTPFSKLDLIVCRNLLIYLEPEVQKKVIAFLHFSLNEGGFLFLGSSETIGRHADLFEPVSKKWRIFRRIGPARPVEVPIAVMSPPLFPAPRIGNPPQATGAPPSRTRPVNFADMTHRLLLDQFAPPTVLVNRKHEILYFCGRTDRYLAVPVGEPTQDLMMLAREGLGAKLRAGINKAVRENGPVTLAGAQVKHNGDYHPVNVSVRPVPEQQGAEGLLLVMFQDADQKLAPPLPPETVAEESVVRQLEYDLKATREDLQSTVEEMESSNEELKASNEEVMSMNEELQSANGELQTSKEELQSLNEELNTVNNHLQDKVEELESANNDMANLLNCTDVAIIFLDNHFRIKRYTPSATKLFSIIATDLGRPISDIAAKFPNSTLQQEVELALQTLTPNEKQMQTPDGCWWSRRITLYRTVDNHIEGAILTFADVTQVRRSDEQAMRLAAVLLDSNDAVCVHDFDGRISAWNRGAEEMLGYVEAEAFQMNEDQMIPEDLRARSHSLWEQLRRGERVNSWESQRRTKDGRILDVWVTATALKDATGRPIAIAKTERDITEQKRAHAHLENEVQQRTAALRNSQDQLAAVLHTGADAVITINAMGIIQSVNTATERMFDYTAGELIGQNIKILMPSPFREEHERHLDNYNKTGVRKIIGIGREAVAQRKNGSTFPVELAVSEADHRQLFTGILRDITERKELEREVLEVASREQRRIGQDLHDTVGQELTALNIRARDLADTLRTDPASGFKLVEQMIQGLQRSQRDLRAVLRGLLPVAVDAEGLMSALADLADRIQQEAKATCAFDSPEPVSVADNLVATHLYLIAQEAVHNAVKHARPTNIRIILESNALLTLRVRDDGIGMPADPAENQGGLGLRIMRNRAAIIGANLTIERAAPHGTVVTCTLQTPK